MLQNPIVTDAETLRRVLAVFSALDGVRWSHATNYNLINYCADDLTADEKLLTHWLCYVTDRQTGFERIWEVGGYVISHMVRAFCRGKVEPDRLLSGYLRPGKEQGKLQFECGLAAPNARLSLYGIDKAPVIFASRYIPSDAVSICRTFLILDRLAGRRFGVFIRSAVSGEKDMRSALRRMASAVQFLTYDDIGQPAAADVPKVCRGMSAHLAPAMKKFSASPDAFVDTLVREFDSFGKKRLWCAIRDYLKSPEFNPHLVAAIATLDPTESMRWRRDAPALKAALDVMELPGDVWNNNAMFRDGLFTPRLRKVPKSWDMPRTVRRIDDEIKGTAFYPEQLDVTFDFVPRMCSKRSCPYCFFGGGIQRLCHQKKGLLCPVTLATCGYEHTCEPDGCPFKVNALAGACKKAVLRGNNS